MYFWALVLLNLSIIKSVFLNALLKKNIYIYIFLAVPGLTCGMQHL